MKKPDVPESWFELLDRLYDLRPITTQKAHTQAMQALRVMIKIQNRTKDQNDYFKALSDAIGIYESQAYPLQANHDPIENLKFLLEANEMTASDLGRLLGDRSLGSRILNKQRSLSKAHIKTISQRFRVSPAAFI